MDKTMVDRIRSFEAELIEIRRDLHRHPEVGFKEMRTAGIVAGYLENLGIEVHQGLAATGVIGTLRGTLPGSRVVGLRADMDALSIQEATELPYASANDGVMHACGHDGHTAMLLGAARYLSEHRDFSGTVRFIFQPAEESFGGGRVMVEEGLFDRFPCDAVYGMHGMPGIPAGQFAIRTGPFMASGDTWTVTFKGTGGHGAMPHRATDPTMPAAAFISALQSIVGRNVPSDEPAVLSVGHLDAGRFDAPNIIPDQVLIRGTARCYNADVRSLLEGRIAELSRSVAKGFGCEADPSYLRRYPALVNREEQTGTAVRAAIRVAGNEGVNANAPRFTGSEDFAFMLEQVPGAYITIGCGDRDFVHTPKYDFNDDTILPGVGFWATLVSLELGGDGDG